MRLIKKLLKWTVIVLIIGLGSLVGLERLAAERVEGCRATSDGRAGQNPNYAAVGR